jgi:hypothetical protein
LTLTDVQYYPRQGAQTTDKLYWVMYEYYLPEYDETSFGWCELDFSNLQSQGTWRLDDFAFSATSRYLFDVPQEWADAYTPDKYLAGGRCRIPNNGSWGPALYVFGPWNDGNPPSDGASLDAVQLLKYGSELTVRDFSHSDDWQDGAWLTVGGKSAVVIAGMRALRTAASGLEYYGEPGVDGCGYKGYHAEPYYGAVLFYDPYLLAQVVHGTLQPHEVQPYAELNVEDYLFQQGCRRGILGGVGYDRQRNLLYVLEKYVEGYYARKPIVHVWRVVDDGQPPDSEPPSVPSNLQLTGVTSTTVGFGWDAAYDDVHLAGYIVYRNGAPAATTVDSWYTDDKVNPGATYSYTVQSWDAASNRSAHSAPLVVTTPPGADARAPIITDFRITDITATSAVVRWRTDEPATTRVQYEIIYSGNPEIIENAALATDHVAHLIGLTPGSTYVCQVASADGVGNEYEHPGKQFVPPHSGGGGYTPVLNPIGAQRVDEGELLVFSIAADDQDSVALSYSATGLPAGAGFDPTGRRLSWRPGSDDVGVHRVTFAVSDGARSDSESVAIFVLPALTLHATPADRAAHLSWTYGGDLPAGGSWRITYYSQTVALSHTSIPSPTRAYTLANLANYVWYTVTLNGMVGGTPFLTSMARVMPTGNLVYLPIVFRGN